MSTRNVDCLIVGGGPAGLTAAIYLARFHLNVVVADSGDSRAALIPKTRNHAGFPEGISGPNLLRRMNQQARIYGVRIEETIVSGLHIDGDDFRADTGTGTITARAVLLATGVVNNRPEMADDLHDEALARGLLRYCPICDGYEVTDQAIGVIGTGARGTREALFLRGYSADITLIAPGHDHALDEGQQADLARAGIKLLAGPSAYVPGPHGISVFTDAGCFGFASLYPALGSVVRSDLAMALGAKVSDEGCMLVDSHQRSSIPGLYAAGDVVLGLDQISHAMGEGGVAATTIRNDLAARTPIWR
jgi:thioredoxin reductase (NADPH)